MPTATHLIPIYDPVLGAQAPLPTVMWRHATFPPLSASPFHCLCCVASCPQTGPLVFEETIPDTVAAATYNVYVVFDWQKGMPPCNASHVQAAKDHFLPLLWQAFQTRASDPFPPLVGQAPDTYLACTVPVHSKNGNWGFWLHFKDSQPALALATATNDLHLAHNPPALPATATAAQRAAAVPPYTTPVTTIVYPDTLLSHLMEKEYTRISVVVTGNVTMPVIRMNLARLKGAVWSELITAAPQKSVDSATGYEIVSSKLTLWVKGLARPLPFPMEVTNVWKQQRIPTSYLFTAPKAASVSRKRTSAVADLMNMDTEDH